MNTYMVLMEQAGEGCDYTIRCGQLYEEIQSELDHETFTVQHIQQYVFNEEGIEQGQITECATIDYERKLSEFRVIDLSTGDSTYVDCEEYYASAQQAIDEINEQLQNKADNEEFERLRAKLNR